MDHDMHDRFRDLLQEVPEAEAVLVRWKKERARESVRAAIARDRQAALDAAWESLLARDRVLRPLD